jgi:D-alanyl-D-alanine carboxypeptidase
LGPPSNNIRIDWMAAAAAHHLRALTRTVCSTMQPVVAASIALLLVLAVAVAQAEANPRYAALVVDVNSGEALFEAEADAPRFPASLTKMMTLYILFEEIDAGRLTAPGRSASALTDAGCTTSTRRLSTKSLSEE